MRGIIAAAATDAIFGYIDSCFSKLIMKEDAGILHK